MLSRLSSGTIGGPSCVALAVVYSAAVGCAGLSGTIPNLIVTSSTEGRGWPYGESGNGIVMTLEEEAKDRSYGWDHREPVRLGGHDAVPPQPEGDERQIVFLNSLWGPEGQTVFYERIGRCCPFQVFGAVLDKGMLDVYALTWDGLAKPKHIFLDRYRKGPLRIPVGLTTKVRNPSRGLREAGRRAGVAVR